MNRGSNAWPRDWQQFKQFIVNVLTGAATITVAFAALDAATDFVYPPLIALALVGAGLMLEPDVTARPAGDIGSFDAAIGEATSV